MKNKWTSHPKNLFLVDGLGAILSIIMLGFVLVQLQHYVGLPVKTLYLLASIPVVFFFYDLYCYLYLKRDWKKYLGFIALANLLYCVGTGYILYSYYQDMPVLGVTYFVLEILVILVIVYLQVSAMGSRTEA